MSQSPWQTAPAPLPPSGRTDSILAPSPMGIGALFGTAWRLMTSKLGLLLGLNVLQSVIIYVVTIVGILLGAGIIAGIMGGFSGSPSGGQVAGAVVVGLVVLLVVLAIVFWVSIKFSAMGVAALDLRARGQESSWSAASVATRGVVRRAITVILIEVLAVVAVYAVFGLLFGGALASQSEPGAGAIGLMLLLGTVLGLAGVYVGIRLAYLNQVLAVERLGGMDVFRRAWQLTRGRFWPTLGRSILGMLAPMVVLSVLSSMQASNIAASDRIDGTPASSGLALLLGLAMMVVSILSGIWVVAFLTSMYIDQVRRHAAAGIAPVAVAPAPAMPTMAPAALPADTWGQQPVGPLGAQQPAQPVVPTPPVDAQPSPWTTPGQQPTQPTQPPTIPVDEDGNPWNRPSDGKGGL